MLRILYILILLPFVGFSQLKTDTQLTNDLNNLVPNNTSQLIKPVHIRTVIQNGYDSRVSMYGETGILGKLTYVSLFTFTDPKDIVNKKYVDDAVIGFSGGVTSFNTRIGAITPLSTDYSAYYYPATGNPSGFLTAIPTLTAADIPNLDATKITTGAFADARISSAATWNAKQNAIGLTTTGTSGAATLIGATINIPNYTTTPAGTTGQVQFNNAGAFGASNNLFWNSTTNSLGVGAVSPLAKLHVSVSSGAVIPLIIQRPNTESGDITQWKNGATIIANMNGAGSFFTQGSLQSNALIGDGTTRAVEVNGNGTLVATQRLNKTLFATVYNPATQHTLVTEANYGTYTIPSGLMAKDGDAIKLEVTGQLLAATGSNSLAGYFGGTFVFSKTFSGGSTTRSASLSFTVIRTSNTTAVIHVQEPANAQTSINTSNGDMITRTGLNFTTNTYTINAAMAGDGTAAGAALGAVRITFEPAP